MLSSCHLEVQLPPLKLCVCLSLAPLQASLCKVLERSSVLQVSVYLSALWFCVVMTAILVFKPIGTIVLKRGL